MDKAHQKLQNAKNQRFLALLVSKLGTQRSLAGSNAFERVEHDGTIDVWKKNVGLREMFWEKKMFNKLLAC